MPPFQPQFVLFFASRLFLSTVLKTATTAEKNLQPDI